jgi:hypothetical protein
MRRRAVDLSIEELAALGANAALRAAKEAQAAGLIVTGTVDFLDKDQPKSSLAERHPSGAVTIRGSGETVASEGNKTSDLTIRRSSD